MEKEKKVAHLSIFLIKKEFVDAEKIIHHEECQRPIKIPIGSHETGSLYFKRTEAHSPKWASFFEDTSITEMIGLVSNISAVLIINVDVDIFVLSFGQGGRFLIKENVFEERFGLLVTLNSVDKKSLRCIDKHSLDAIQSHTRIQSSQETTADQFGIDVEQDMLKAVVGTPKDPSLGSRMAGTDSLSASVRMQLSDLPYILSEYSKQYQKDLDATDYQWVNNISLLKNCSPKINTLNTKLLEKLQQREFKNLWLAIPEIIEWNIVKGFIFSGGNGVLHPDINLHAFFKTVKSTDNITLDLLYNRKVSCADEDHKKVFKSWPIYKCIYAEIELNGEKYILNDSKWFNVNTTFVEKTNRDFSQIPRSKLNLQEYNGGGEGYYNASISANNPEQFALLDDREKIFHGGGRGQIEICDIFTTEKNFIHVKMYGKSSVFSHLISQGFVSGQLFQIDSEFREKVKNKLPNSFNHLVNIDKRPSENEYTITYAIISDSEGEDVYLPFFSRVNMNNAFKILKGFGFNVELMKIKVNSDFSKTQIIPKN